jgi:hypothetical protein
MGVVEQGEAKSHRILIAVETGSESIALVTEDTEVEPRETVDNRILRAYSEQKAYPRQYPREGIPETTPS